MIHKYRLNGCNFVLDICSGAVHILDNLAYDMVDFVDENMKEDIPLVIIKKFEDAYKKSEILECYRELYELWQEGQLFSKDDYEKFIAMRQNVPIKALCLNIAHDCNLRCHYCFAAKGDFGCGRKLMPLKVGKSAIDFLIQNSGNRVNLEVDFFGGEPLMNFEVVEQIVNYAKSIQQKYNKNFRFTITTNGLLLDKEKIDFINQEMSNVVLSIDGRKLTNDRLRVASNGKGSYDIIIPKYEKLVSTRGDKDYYIRGTYTAYNLDFTEDILHLADRGFKNISVEPVVSDADLEYAIKEKDLPKIFEEYEKLSRILLERLNSDREFNFFHFSVDLNQGTCAIKRLRGCGCGNEYVAITPEGDIFPCHQFVGHECWKMGNVMANTFTQKIKDLFSKTHIYSKPDCKNCWAKFYCSGGCCANNWQYEGDVLKSHRISCELQKKRLECAIMFQALKMDLSNV
ncbi:MAG: thioether cross-link-forming SCIFF peptide maturase [Oscillospiraceae bacterium]|jgi:uncharacterized protein|nr:thioether cross-link-forming SCIFF peptide maturase [Oscillospiraceae bacterium]